MPIVLVDAKEEKEANVKEADSPLEQWTPGFGHLP
jgi:hypothetical protein